MAFDIQWDAMRASRLVRDTLPGIVLCGTVSAVAMGLQLVEVQTIGRPYLEAVVLAILLGIAVRGIWHPGARWKRGIDFSAKTLLEIAVMALGATISAQAIVHRGMWLLAGVAAVVAASIVVSYLVGRGLKLSHRLSLLIACGNSICGNSAIAAVAPIIDAEADDVASSIAFTAVLGVAVVLLLPLLVPLLHLSPGQYGVLAGLTVYAVPQVLAATVPVGLLSTQLGTLVKMMRVLMLGPVVLLLSLGVGHPRGTAGKAHRIRLTRLVPWFIIGFVILAALRSAEWLPAAAIGPASIGANILTVIAMAALGLSVDLRSLRHVGGRVSAAAAIAILMLGAISLFLIRLLGIA